MAEPDLLVASAAGLLVVHEGCDARRRRTVPRTADGPTDADHPPPGAPPCTGPAAAGDRAVGSPASADDALLGDRVAAVDDEHLAGDVGRPRAREEQHRGGDLLGGARSARPGCADPSRASAAVCDPVAIHPGATALTVRPWRASSTASARVSPTSPAFAAAYATSPRIAMAAPVTEVTMTTRPVPARPQVRQRRARREVGGVEVAGEGCRPALRRGAQQVALEVVAARRRSTTMPALLTSTSRPPPRSSAAATTASAPSGVVRSATTPAADVPGSRQLGHPVVHPVGRRGDHHARRRTPRGGGHTPSRCRSAIPRR